MTVSIAGSMVDWAVLLFLHKTGVTHWSCRSSHWPHYSGIGCLHQHYIPLATQQFCFVRKFILHSARELDGALIDHNWCNNVSQHIIYFTVNKDLIYVCSKWNKSIIFYETYGSFHCVRVQMNLENQIIEENECQVETDA